MHVDELHRPIVISVRVPRIRHAMGAGGQPGLHMYARRRMFHVKHPPVRCAVVREMAKTAYVDGKPVDAHGLCRTT